MKVPRFFHYFPCSGAVTAAATKPLVVLLPWLEAKPSHVQKYCQLYHERCHNVLTVTLAARHFLWPSSSFAIASGLVDYLRNETANQELVFHSFSIGSYLYAVMLYQILKSPESYRDITSRITGQIFDSVTIGGTARMATGLATTLTSNPMLRRAVVASTGIYFAITRPWTVHLYDKTIDAFFNNHIRSAPILYFYSLNDPMCDPEHMRQLIECQSLAGHTVVSKVWTDSKHAAHFAMHPEEYERTLDSFLATTTKKMSTVSSNL